MGCCFYDICTSIVVVKGTDTGKESVLLILNQTPHFLPEFIHGQDYQGRPFGLQRLSFGGGGYIYLNLKFNVPLVIMK